MRRRLVPLSTLASVAACGLGVTGTAPPGGTDGGSHDGSADVQGDDASGDGGVDGGDAAGDSAHDGDAGGAFCAAAPPGTVFCSDFENAGASPFGWTDTFVDVGTTGTFTVVPSPMRLTGHALAVHIQPSANASHAAWLRAQLPSPLGFSIEELTFDVLVDQPTGLTFAVVGAIWLTNFGSAIAPGVAAGASGTQLDYSGPDGNGNMPVAAAGWHTVSVRYTLQSGTTYMVAVAVDGPILRQRTIDLGSYAESDVRIGAYYTSVEIASFTASFTNVLVRRTP